MHYLKVRELPESIRAALVAGEYGKADVAAYVHETIALAPPSGEGRRGYTAVCDLASDRFEITWGAWGGCNAFVQTIDNASDPVAVPLNVAIVQGAIGGGHPAMAFVTIHPTNSNRSLLPPAAGVTALEAKILAIFRSLKSFARKGYLDRAGATAADVDALVARGYLSRNRAGATAITTEGKNAAGKDYY